MALGAATSSVPRRMFPRAEGVPMAPARWSQINAARSRRQRSKCALECHRTPGHLVIARTAIWAQAPSRPAGRARVRSERSAEPCTVPSTDRASIAGWPVTRRWFRSSSSRVRGSGHRFRRANDRDRRQHLARNRVRNESRFVVTSSRTTGARSSGESGSDPCRNVTMIRSRALAWNTDTRTIDTGH